MNNMHSKRYNISNQVNSSLCKALNNLRINKQLCDVTLVAAKSGNPSQSSQSVKKDMSPRSGIVAHRAVLSSSSPFFKGMFTNEFLERDQQEVVLNDVDHEVLLLIIEFVYTGEVVVDVNNVQALFSAASLFQIESLRSLCTQFMQERLDVNNCLGVLRFAKFNSCELLKEATEKFIKIKFEQVSGGQELLECSLKELTELIGDDQLKVKSEETIYSTITRWLEHDLERRKQHLETLFPFVRLELLSRKFLIEKVIENSLFDCSLKCKSLMFEAMKNRLSKIQLDGDHSKSRLASQTRILVVGGRVSSNLHFGGVANSSGKCELYDSSTNVWNSISSVKTLRSKHGLVALNKKVFVFGGLNNNGHSLTTGEYYDTGNGSWADIACMTQPRDSFGTCALNGQLWAVGGLYNGSSLSTMQSYDPVRNQWLSSISMNNGRSDLSCVSLDNVLYVFGGKDYYSTCLNTVQKFDPRESKWSFVASMSSARYGHSAVVFNRQLYVAGGCGNNVLNSVEAYDPRADRWRSLAPLSKPRLGHCMVELDGQLYVLGGFIDSSQNNCSESVEIYNIAENRWIPGTPMPTKRAYFGAASLQP